MGDRPHRRTRRPVVSTCAAPRRHRVRPPGRWSGRRWGPDGAARGIRGTTGTAWSSGSPKAVLGPWTCPVCRGPGLDPRPRPGRDPAQDVGGEGSRYRPGRAGRRVRRSAESQWPLRFDLRVTATRPSMAGCTSSTALATSPCRMPWPPVARSPRLACRWSSTGSPIWMAGCGPRECRSRSGSSAVVVIAPLVRAMRHTATPAAQLAALRLGEGCPRRAVTDCAQGDRPQPARSCPPRRVRPRRVCRCGPGSRPGGVRGRAPAIGFSWLLPTSLTAAARSWNGSSAPLAVPDDRPRSTRDSPRAPGPAARARTARAGLPRARTLTRARTPARPDSLT